MQMPQGEFSIGGTLWAGLSKLIEECGEAADVVAELILVKLLGRMGQITGKIIGAEGRADHWDGSHLPTRLTEELGDVLGTMRFVARKNGLDWRTIVQRADEKEALFEDWHADRLARRESL